MARRPITRRHKDNVTAAINRRVPVKFEAGKNASRRVDDAICP